MIAVWYSILLLVLLASAGSASTLYSTQADQVQAAEAINASPGLVALYGPILDVHSKGELAMTKMTVVYAVLVALMLLFVVRRHTRMDEENGQAELLGGTALRTTGPLAAALTFGAGVSVALGLLAAAGNIATGLPVAGSLAFGACWAGTGLVATGLTALACQISPSARTCAGIAVSAILGLFVVRAVGDTTEASWLSWLSPFGWNTHLRAFSETRWWVLLLYIASAAALAGAAWTLRLSRDLGGGLVAPRPGPATGSPRLADAIALSLRVHAPMLVGWTVGMAVLGLVFGAISPSFDAFDSPSIQQMLQRLGGAGAFRDTLLGAVVSVVALIVTCFAIAVVNHGGSDEQDGRTEQILATATSRTRAFVATAIVAIGGATWLLAVVGVGLAIGVGNDTGHSFARLVASPLSQAPAVWTVIALSLLCYALRSRWAILGWGLLVVFATLGQIGELLNLPDWTLQLSPFTHSPAMPLQPFELGPALALTGIAAAVLVGAWLRFRGRDIG
ncbi:ABC transporter permease [Angustibacter sp. McL0619]|uniref:ABC transporter permease n=1 Tax=Angustibacter sp. McL0619 TaxID=3415676 RepID=UPI003CF707AE